MWDEKGFGRFRRSLFLIYKLQQYLKKVFYKSKLPIKLLIPMMRS